MTGFNNPKVLQARRTEKEQTQTQKELQQKRRADLKNQANNKTQKQLQDIRAAKRKREREWQRKNRARIKEDQAKSLEDAKQEARARLHRRIPDSNEAGCEAIRTGDPEWTRID